MGLFGSPVKTTSTQTPWGPQADALKFAFGQAQDIFKSKVGTPWYTGDLYAGLDPLTQQGIDATGQYATGAGAAAANGVANAANPLLGASNDFLRSIGAYYGAANADPTGANIQAAGQYANNPYLNSQIDAVGSDIKRNLSENVLPEIDRAASSTGNINSSRAGIASGVAMRGAQETMANTAANMRSQAYQNGLGLAENARTANLGAMGNAAGMYGNATSLGFQGAQQGQGMNYQNLDAMIKAGQISQADAQGQLDADFARWQGNDTRDMDLLKQYYGIIGSNNWGGTTTTKQTGGGPGILGGILGGLSTVGSMFASGGALGAGGGLTKLFSDRRTKENIVLVGVRPDGLNEYEFDYRQDLGLDVPQGRQRGVMADEVAVLRPDALGPIENGYQTVDYGRL